MISNDLFQQDVLQGVRDMSEVGKQMELSEGVYLDVVKGKIKNEVLSKKDLIETGDVIFLDTSLSMRNPSLWYIKLMKAIKVKKKDCQAQLEGFTEYKRVSGAVTLFPDITGGKFNPYIKYRSNRSSASIRMRHIDRISMILNCKGKTSRKLHMIKLNVTFPKEVSDVLFWDKDCLEKVNKINKLFDNRAFGKEFGIWSNIHLWASNNPLDPHIHIHKYMPNVKYTISGFERFQPLFSKPKISRIKKIWCECMSEVLEFGKPGLYEKFSFVAEDVNVDIKKFEKDYDKKIKYDQKKINIWVAYIESYKFGEDDDKQNRKARSLILHALKYNTRSYLVDLAKYFDRWKTPKHEEMFERNYEDFKRKFKRFVELKAIKNNTTSYGFIRKIKSIVHKNDTKENNLYWLCYGKSSDVLKGRCPISQEIYQGKSRHISEFRDIKDFQVYLAVKSGYIKIGTIRIRKKSDKDRGKNKSLDDWKINKNIGRKNAI